MVQRTERLVIPFLLLYGKTLHYLLFAGYAHMRVPKNSTTYTTAMVVYVMHRTREREVAAKVLRVTRTKTDSGCGCTTSAANNFTVNYSRRSSQYHIFLLLCPTRRSYKLTTPHACFYVGLSTKLHKKLSAE